ncbi:MAG: site-2 protease family protein [Proteobacteria bacterium]|nr:site-2 protease family protein [Pseudomonadota bacterium]
MNSSLLLGKLFNIKLYVHWTFLLLIGWVLLIESEDGLTVSEAIFRILFIFALFACVVLHELGHALTARRFDCPTRRIVLMAEIEKMPQKPWQELLVAIAGPLVSLAIAFVLYVIVNGNELFPTASQIENMNIDEFIRGYFLFYLCLVNFMLAIFNLIPAFPMDGGRMLRALLAMRLGKAKATRISATIGQFLAIIFVILAIKAHSPWLAIIGIFIFLSAKGEAAQESAKNYLSRYKVGDLTMHQFTILNFNDTIEKAVQTMLNGQEREFVVVNNEQQVIGILTRDNIIAALAQKNHSLFIHQAMDKKFLKLNPEINLAVAYEQMLTNRFAVAAVMEDERLVGIVDIENLQEFMLFKRVSKKS